MTSLRPLSGVLLAAALSHCAVLAATATGNMVVTATVLDTCVLVVPPLAFGNYSGTQLDAQSDVLVTCTGTTAWTVDIDGGGAADIANRVMTGATDTLGYQLYNDAGRSVIFGDGTTGSTVTGTGLGTAQTVSVYGRIPADNFADIGAYTDTVTVTVTY